MSEKGREFSAKRTLVVKGKAYTYYSLQVLEERLGSLAAMPFSLKILLENLLRQEGAHGVTFQNLEALVHWSKTYEKSEDMPFSPARVLMQDFTGVPAIVDLAALREAILALGGDAQTINPLTPVDLVIDHSVMVDGYGHAGAFDLNVRREFERNKERYTFLKWGQKAFQNFRVVPPGTGICHQVNLEYLGQGVWTSEKSGETLAYPDTVVGTDSHTTMINALGILGWGVGGIEAEAVMLAQPISMEFPEVVGVKLTGSLREGTTATDVVLELTQKLRQKGVVGKFVEFYGSGLSALTLADRATLSNMAPEYGATCGFFPFDTETLKYLSLTGRSPETLALVEAYAKAQGLWRDDQTPDPHFTHTLLLDLSQVESCLAGPKRPQDRVLLSHVRVSCEEALKQEASNPLEQVSVTSQKHSFTLEHGHVVIAAITSCTNTSNPAVMIGAGLLAQKAVERGLKTKPWVKTSLAPGSQVVTDYLERAGLQTPFDALGFHLVGYGCTTCIGNSGALEDTIAQAIRTQDLCVGAVLSGNRNFEGRIHPLVKLNYLASPPLVVAYALAGSLKVDLSRDPLGTDGSGNPVYLKDIWPHTHEIQEAIQKTLTPALFQKRYAQVFEGGTDWKNLSEAQGLTYSWNAESTYIRRPPFLQNVSSVPEPVQDIVGARPLALLGDSITTDHISPAGSIKEDSPAGHYLVSHGVKGHDFNSYGARRGNHEVMMRGTFANIRLVNEMAPERSGGYTRYEPQGTVMSLYEASLKYQAQNIPLLVVGGREYGTGSSRDWAAKGTRLLGVKTVLAESFERIHRSNLIGMGVLPLQFLEGESRKTLGLTGKEVFDIKGLKALHPKMFLDVMIHDPVSKTQRSLKVLCRLDTTEEVAYYQHGGILPYVLRELLKRVPSCAHQA